MLPDTMNTSPFANVTGVVAPNWSVDPLPRGNWIADDDVGRYPVCEYQIPVDVSYRIAVTTCGGIAAPVAAGAVRK